MRTVVVGAAVTEVTVVLPSGLEVMVGRAGEGGANPVVVIDARSEVAPAPACDADGPLVRSATKTIASATATTRTVPAAIRFLRMRR